jgi:hypothetical protein
MVYASLMLEKWPNKGMELFKYLHMTKFRWRIVVNIWGWNIKQPQLHINSSPRRDRIEDFAQTILFIVMNPSKRMPLNAAILTVCKYLNNSIPCPGACKWAKPREWSSYKRRCSSCSKQKDWYYKKYLNLDFSFHGICKFNGASEDELVPWNAGG